MNLPNELWYNTFSFLTQKSQSKFSCLLNLYNLSTEEIELIWSSSNLWFDTASKGYSKLIKLLIKAGGVNVNIQDKDNLTPLHLASNRGNKDCVELLIKAGANVNIQNCFDNTALHLASNRGNKDCVELLIKAY